MTRIKIKDLRQGMRVVEYGYGRAVETTIREDARLTETPGQFGYVAIGDTQNGWAVEFFECHEGSPYGPHLYLLEVGQ